MATRNTSTVNKVEEEPASPGARLFNQPDFNYYILVIFSFKTPINLTVFKQLMAPLLHHPRFSSLLQPVNGTKELKWVRTEVVDINDHVIVPILDTAAGTSPDKAIEDYISDLSKTNMHMSRPMWEWHVLNVKTSDDAESTIVFRLHHSLGDGVSQMSLLLSLAQDDSNSEALCCGVTTNIKQQGPRNIGLGGWLTRVRHMFLVLLNTSVSSIMILGTLCLNLRDTETPLRRTSSSTTRWNSHTFVRKTISLDDVKMVKNAMAVTINDVMLGVAQAGLSRYLHRKYGEAEKDTTNRNTLLPHPKNIRVRATVAVNLRPSSGIPDVAEMMKMKSKVGWGNKIGLVVVPFNTAQKDDILDYVRESKTSMDKKKASLEPNLSYLMSRFYPSMVTNFVKKTTLAFSNIAGPRREITLFGHQVSNISPTIYAYGEQPIALVVHVGSYGNKMNIVCSVDDSVISDPHQLSNDLGEAFDIIKQSVVTRSTSS